LIYTKDVKVYHTQLLFATKPSFYYCYNILNLKQLVKQYFYPLAQIQVITIFSRILNRKAAQYFLIIMHRQGLTNEYGFTQVIFAGFAPMGDAAIS